MQALVYRGERDIRCESVPDAVLPDERGAVVQVRAAGVCGSDLHIYSGHAVRTRRRATRWDAKRSGSWRVEVGPR